MSRLKSKRCVITEASLGIGLDATKLFGQEGAQVLATDINEAPFTATACGSGISPCIRFVSNQGQQPDDDEGGY